jgi:DNA-binding PadR family transcriptional regulator
VKISKELIKGTTEIMILSLIEKQPMYGYEMISAIEKESGGIFAFKEGTLYPILHLLESDSLIASYWVGEEGSRRRKYYKITERGKKQLVSKRTEWANFSSAVNKVIGEALS